MELWGAVRWEIFARGERLDKGRRGMGPVRGRGMGPVRGRGMGRT